MKFFVPDESPEHAEDIYNDFRELHNAADKRIRSITFAGPKPGEQVRLCVGEVEPWQGGKILLILFSYPRFYVFTHERGIDTGLPITVQAADVRVEDFEPLDRPNRLGQGA